MNSASGRIPLVAIMQSREKKNTYLKNLCEETYLKDIIQRNGIKKTTELSELLDVAASSIGAPVNALRLTNTFKSVTKKSITDDTVSNYLGFFEEAFLLSKVKKYSIKGKKYIGAPFKLYRPEKEAQEKKSLYYIDDSFPKIVITKDGLNPRTDEKGIVVMDLFDFLMNW